MYKSIDEMQRRATRKRFCLVSEHILALDKARRHGFIPFKIYFF